jgi:predicted nucleic acid-binding protein
MAARIDAYIDTSAFIAFADASDTYHAVFRRLFAAPPQLRRFTDQDLTLVDAVGLHFMRSESATSCWSTDRHLGLVGTPLAIHTV